jgi:hypothetical protein
MTFPALPTVGSSDNTWGTQLNACLTWLATAPGALLATVQYGPTPQTTYNAVVGTLTALDTANLTISFTVPPSGNFYIDVAMDWGYGTTSGNSAVVDMFLGIALHGALTTLLSPIQSWYGTDMPNVVAGGRDLHRYYSTGNTPGPIQADLIMGVSNVSAMSWGAFYASASGVLSSDPTCPALIQAFAA